MNRAFLARAARTLGLAGFVWLLIYVGSCIVMMVSILFALFGVGAEPLFVVLQHVPTLGLYAVVGWTGWRLSPPPLNWLGALAGLAATAFLPSFAVNVETARRVAAAQADDIALAAPASRPASVALLVTRRSGSASNGDDGRLCGNFCQRLLYSGGVGEVVVGRLPPGFDIARTRGLTGYRVERRALCPPVEIPEASGIAGEKHSWQHPVSTAVRQQIAAGHCLIARNLDRLEAEHVWIEGDPENPLDEFRSREGAGPFLYRFEHFERRDGRYVRVGRHTHIRYARARTPFFGRFALDMSFALEIAVGEPLDAQDFPSDAFGRLFGRWLGRPAAVGAAEAGRQIDRSLAGAGAGSDRAQLYWAFIDMLADKERWDPGDAERLARIILSPDFHPETRFNIANETFGRAIEKSRGESRIVGDAILRRGLAADPVRDQLLLHALSQSLAWLPHGTFAGSGPLLDRVVNDPVRRGRLPWAVFRLSDRGAAGAPQLLRIVTEDLGHWPDESGHPGARAVVSQGIEGLCRVAPRAPGAAPGTRALIARLSREPALHRNRIQRLRDVLRVMEGGAPRQRPVDGRIVESC